MNESITIKKGQRTRVIHRVSNNSPASYLLQAKVINPHELLSGYVEIEKSAILLDKRSVQIALKANFSLRPGFWDAFYTVYIVPEQDIRLTITNESAIRLKYLLIAILVIVIIALSLFVILMN